MEESELRGQLQVLSRMNLELEDEIEHLEEKLQKERQSYQSSLSASQRESNNASARKSEIPSQIASMDDITSRSSQPAVLEKRRQIISVRRVERDNSCWYLLLLATVLLSVATLSKMFS